MRRIGSFIINHDILVTLLLIAAVGFLGWHALHLEENLSFETLYLSDDPNIEFSENFAANFENVNDMVAIALTGDDLFNSLLLEAVERITHKLEKIKEVDVVYSLTNSRYIQGTEDGLDISNLLEQIPQNPQETEQIKKKVLNYPLFKGRLLSADGKYMAIIVQTADIVGQPVDTHIGGLFTQLAEQDPQVREAAIKSLSRMKRCVFEVIRTDDPQYTLLVRQLIEGNPKVRRSALAKLAPLGSMVVRSQTVANRRDLIAQIEKIVNQELPAKYKHYITGTNVIERDYARIIRKDKIIFQTLTALILLIAFYLSFHSMRDTSFAFITLFLAVVSSLGMVQLIGGVIDIINSVIFTMVLVVGTSDIIHMTHGFYRQWRPEEGHEAGKKAAMRMVQSMGFACLMTSLTTACGFFSLYFARIGTISHFGLNMGVSIMVTYAVSLICSTLLFSRVKNLPKFRTRLERESSLDHLIQWLASLVIDRWQAILIACICFVICFAIGFNRLYVESHVVSELPETSPTKINIEAMNNLAGFIGFEVSVKAKKGGKVIDPQVLRKVEQIATYLKQQPETLKTWSVVDYVKTMNQAANDGSSKHYNLPDSAEAIDQYLLLYTFTPEGLKEMNGLISQDRQWLRIVSRLYDVGAGPYLKLRDRVEQLGSELFPEHKFEVKVTSEMSLLHVAMDRMVHDLLFSMIWAFGFIAFLMAFSLRSIRLGLVAILPNVIPLLATIGFMGLTGIALRVGTLVVFSLGLGIAVDDTIHYLLCYRNERPYVSNYREGILRCHSIVAKPMILTSLVLIAGFFGTFFATFKSIWQMGLLCSFTMVTALMADLLLAPLLLRFIKAP